MKKNPVLIFILLFLVFDVFGNDYEAGFLSIDSVPSGLNVYVDGKIVGKTPLKKHITTYGNRVVSVEAEPCFKSILFYTWNRNVFIEHNQETYLKVIMVPETTNIKIGEISVDGKKIEGLPIYVDGIAIGEQPGSFEVPVCSQLLEITEKNGKKVLQSSSLDLLKGKIIQRHEKGYAITTKETGNKKDTPDPTFKTTDIDYISKSFHLKFEKKLKPERKIFGQYKWYGTGLIFLGALTTGLGGILDYLSYKEFEEYKKMGTVERIKEKLSEDSFNYDNYTSKREDHYSTGSRYSTARTVLYIAGGISFTTGIILLFIPDKKKPDKLPDITFLSMKDSFMINTSIKF